MMFSRVERSAMVPSVLRSSGAKPNPAALARRRSQVELARLVPWLRPCPRSLQKAPPRYGGHCPET